MTNVYILIHITEGGDEPILGVFDSMEKAKEKLIQRVVDRCSIYGSDRDVKKIKHQVKREMKYSNEFLYCEGSLFRIDTKTIQ